MSESKLCPFRKATIYNVFVYSEFERGKSKFEVPQSEFLPCLEDKCAMWREIKTRNIHEPTLIYTTFGCGLAGKP